MTCQTDVVCLTARRMDSMLRGEAARESGFGSLFSSPPRLAPVRIFSARSRRSLEESVKLEVDIQVQVFVQFSSQIMPLSLYRL